MKSIGGGAARLREINRDIILHQLRDGGPQTKAALSAATRLSVATCGNILRDLVAGGEATVLEDRETAGGRPARVYAVNPGHRLAAVLVAESDAGREKTSLTVVDALGRAIHAETRNGRVTAASLDKALAGIRERYPAIRAAAVSIPGWVAGGEIGSCDNPALVGARLEERLRAGHGIDVAVENDMNFAALGYYAARPDLEHASLVYFAFPDGYCPGAGVVVNGILVRGATGLAGEVGYLPLASARRGGAAPTRPGRAAALERMAETVAAVAAIINPRVAVLSGGLTRDLDPADLAARAAGIIPEQHLPELVVRADPAEDRLAGAVAMALRMQSCEVGLVVKKRTWCDDE